MAILKPKKIDSNKYIKKDDEILEDEENAIENQSD